MSWDKELGHVSLSRNQMNNSDQKKKKNQLLFLLMVISTSK